MSTPRHVVIVGAGLAGARCAETLRAEGFEGRVTLVGAEPVVPYERPALSKELLAGLRTPDDLALRPASYWANEGIVLRLGARVAHIDTTDRIAVLAGGGRLDWDALVLATGATARRLADPPPLGVHVLRTISHADGLREELVPGARLAVIGAGFVGSEVASTAAALGLDVTLIDTRAPFLRLLGEEVSELLAERYRAHGVAVRIGPGVAGFRAGPSGRVRSVSLADGTGVPCDVALVAIGADPAVELFAGARRDGIETDGLGRTSVAGVYACGDAALTWHPRLGVPLRVEHWTGAAGQGAAVARSILGRCEPYSELPYFWSDQFGLRLQMVGHAASWHRVELEGGPDSFLARYLDEQGLPRAALAGNRPREIGVVRRELTAAQLAVAA